MPRPLAIDLTRLTAGLLRATPRGIERVEHGVARALLEGWVGDCFAVLPSMRGMRLVDRTQALRLLARADAIWRETGKPQDDANETAIARWLAEGGPAPQLARAAAQISATRTARALAGFIADQGMFFGRPVRAFPQGGVYLNVGQAGLAVTRLVRWLDERRDVKPIILLHDAIPLDFPRFVPPFETKHFRTIVANTARLAAGLVTTTHAAASAVRPHLAAAGRGDIPGVVIPLPAPAGFLAPGDDAPTPSPRGHFVCCGSIEPRKNHLLLFDVWRELVRAHGAAAPKLLVIGTRLRPSAKLVAMLEDATLRDHVCEASGLPTPALRRFVRRARASLMPSFAEGFGLPIVEALAVGTPVIASDIPAHREAGGACARYLDPADNAGWRAAIEELAALDPRLRGDERKPAMTAHLPRDWNDYVARLTPFIESIGA